MPSRAFPQQHADVGVELVREWVPDGEARGAIVLVHGIAEHSGRYERTGELLADSGFYVRAFDLRGAGASGGARWDIESWDLYHDQVADHIEEVRKRGLPVILFGHSMGGNISLGYVLTDRTKPDLLVLSAPALSGGANWQRALAPIAAKVAPKVTLANSVNGEHLSRDPKVAEDYFADPLVVTKSSFRLGAQLFEQMDLLVETCSELTVPTLVVHGGDDVLVATASSEVLEDIACVERKVYDGLRHEILNEPEGPQVVADIVAWIETRLSAS